MSKKKFWIPAAMAAFALVLWAFVRGDGETVPTYRFVTVERGTVESVVTSTGTLQATETVQVGTQVSGQVSEIFVDFNDRVQKGQLLARIDPTILQQEVRAAEANVLRNRAELEQARRGLERNRELHAQKVLTDAELEQSEYQATVAQASLSSAEVSLERARRNLAYTEIRAPIEGVVVERSVDVGQTVAASMSAPVLFLIAQDLSEMEILASVDESDIGKIEQDQEARFTVQAYGATSFVGDVEQVRLQSKVQENVVSYSVVVRVNNDDGRLLPGMTATVEFVVDRAEAVLKVPNTALRFQPTAEMLASAELPRNRAPGDSASGVAGAGAGARRRVAASPPAQARTAGETRERARSMLWHVGEDGGVRAVRVRTGLTDGQATVVEGEGLEEGMEVIAAVAAGAANATAVGANPFQAQQQPRGGQRPGGF